MLHLRPRARAGSRSPVRRALTFWRRSIQARVVASTVLLSAAVISVVGWYLLQQTRDGLLEHRVDAVVAEANDETAEARDRLEVGARHRQRRRTASSRPGRRRSSSAVTPGASTACCSGRPGRAAGSPTAARTSRPALDTSSVPSRCEEHFDDEASTAWTYTTIRTTDADGTSPPTPGIVVGSQVLLPADSETYTLYYLFPLDEQEETLALVTRALLTAAVLLLVLVAGMTWLVTRQVVTPIRMARRVAERLAAGQLQERLRVSGEDDLARLATSFNQMASNLQRQIRQLEELSRVQRRFVSDVSHELRTPLTTVRMAGDVLHDARTDFDPATARAAELLQTELDRFETLLVDLLEISRFDAGAAVLELDDVNLVDVAHRIVDATRPLAEQRDVRVVVQAPDHPCLAEADVRRVERIVRNLVTNAIDHAGSGRRRTPTSWSRWPATTTPRRSPSATTASAWRRGSPRWCSTGSGAPTPRGPAPAAAPASASPSRSRTPTCTAAGCRPGAARGRAPSSG